MPMDRALYPENWEAIALQIKADANWTCENCGRPCRRPGESVNDLFLRLVGLDSFQWINSLCGFEDEDYWLTYLDYDSAPLYPKRFTLTVSHTNHDPWNPDAELRALCAPCHARYDISPEQRERKRKAKLEYLGQLNLLEEPPCKDY